MSESGDHNSKYKGLEQSLLLIPPEQWKVQQAIVLDWHDGPREGVCALIHPRCCFYFRIYAERAQYDEDGALFLLSDLPLTSIDQLETILTDIGPKTSPIWVPIWKFKNMQAKAQAEELIKVLLASARPTNIVLHTQDMIRFLDYWLRVFN